MTDLKPLWEKIEAAYPDWQQIVGRPGANTKYRRWLAKQPSCYRKMMDDTLDPNLVIDSIDRFEKNQHLRWTTPLKVV